jgi:hypothetical protein
VEGLIFAVTVGPMVEETGMTDEEFKKLEKRVADLEFVVMQLVDPLGPMAQLNAQIAAQFAELEEKLKPKG